MKVLLINGSPRGDKSNSLKLSSSFIEGLKEKENIELSKINLIEKNIRQCLGCFSCWKNKDHQCVLKDDMVSLLPLFVKADIVIYSFPLYSFSLPGLMKNLIDRLLPLYEPFMVDRNDGLGNGGHKCRYDLSKQKSILISTCGFYTSKGNYNAVIDMFNLLKGKNGYTSIFVGQGELFSVPALKNRTDQYLEIVKKAGREFINGKIEEETRKELDVYLYPKEVFTTMADASWGVSKEGEKVDEGYVFLKQMSALYDKSSYSGKDLVIYFQLDDINKEYEVILSKDKASVIDKDFLPYTTKITTPLSVWKEIGEEKIRGDQALFEGKYKVEGDFSLMMNWDKYFPSISSNNEVKEKEEKEEKTNMLNFLLPFIAFFSLIPINYFYGTLACLGVIALTSLIFIKTKKTVYDILSSFSIIALSILALILRGDYVNYLVSSSYLLFGIYWLASSFISKPLSSYYSCNTYGGKDAFNNPLFMKTNKILSILWGALYLATAVWTFFLMEFVPVISSYVGLINMVVPTLMGFFTKWFISFYTAHLAKGKKDK